MVSVPDFLPEDLQPKGHNLPFPPAELDNANIDMAETYKSMIPYIEGLCNENAGLNGILRLIGLNSYGDLMDYTARDLSNGCTEKAVSRSASEYLAKMFASMILLGAHAQMGTELPECVQKQLGIIQD